MIAILDRNFGFEEPVTSDANRLFELLQAGDKHWDLTIANIFFEARRLAAVAVSENSETSLIVSALLVRPCQMLACGTFQAGCWSSDSLLETGTYEWLSDNFGEEIAEIIRLQPLAKRFLATVIPGYFRSLNMEEQRNVLSDGGFMTVTERMHFGSLRLYSRAMKIANWIDRGVGRYLEIPDMDFFLPFVRRAHLTRTRQPRFLKTLSV
jgi:predicted HD phosphohydrolase